MLMQNSVSIWTANGRTFSPANMFTDGEQGFAYDISNPSLLFQDAAGTIPVTAAGDPVGRVVDISGRGNNATQSVAAARPRWGRWPLSAVIAGRVRNLLAFTRQFDNAYWTKAGGTTSKITVDDPTEGAISVDQFIPSAISESHNLSRTVTLTGVHTLSIKIKKGTYNVINFISDNQTIIPLNNSFDLDTLTTTGSNSPLIEHLGADVYRLSVRTGVCTGTNVLRVRFFNSLPIATWAGDGVTGVPAWDVQLEAGSVLTTPQIVGASSAWDVTEAGQPTQRFLYFDGLDDFLQTGSINFTATDEMFVCAGVTKVSDAVAAVVELGINAVNAGCTAVFDSVSASMPNRTLAVRSESALISDLPEVLSPTSYVVSTQAKRATPTLSLRRNGVVRATSTAAQGAGNFSNNIVYIGSRAGTSAFFQGNLYSLVMRGKLPTTTQLGQTEQWTARRVKGTL